MRFRLFKKHLTYFVVLFYLCTPMLDNMVCADCIGNAPFQGEIATVNIESPPFDVSSSQKDNTRSSNNSKQGNKSFCSVCANSILSVEINSAQVPVQVVQSVSTDITSPFSELHYSIHKPPPNYLV